MVVDVVDEMNGLWTELREGLQALNAQSPEPEIEKYLNRFVVLKGVEIQTVYPGLEEYDDEADAATAAATRRHDKIQSTMEQLTFPLSDSAWQAFADAVREHLEQSPKDIGSRLAALSEADRAELGGLTKTMRETLS